MKLSKASRPLLLFGLYTALFLLSPTEAAAVQEQTLDFDDAFHEHGAVMMLLAPDTGHILYANNAAVKFYGYPKERLIEMTLADMDAPKAGQKTQALLASKSSGEDRFVLEQQLASGELCTVEIYPYRGEYNGMPVLSCVVHDVTQENRLGSHLRVLVILCVCVALAGVAALLYFQHKLRLKSASLSKANQELANFKELWETFYNADASYVYLKDENLNYVLVNQAFKDLYGLPYDQIIGHDDFAFQEPQYAQMYMRTDREALEQNRLIVTVAPWKDQVFKTTKFPVRLTDGSRGLGAYVTDVTEEYTRQLRKERELKRNELMLEMFKHNFKSTQDQLNYALRALSALSGSQYGSLFLYDARAEEFTLNSWTASIMEECTVPDVKQVYKLADAGIWAECVRKRKPIILNDLNQAPNPHKKDCLPWHVALKRFMSVPVIMDDTIVAVIGFGNKQGDYDETDANEMAMLISGVWNAVQRRESNETLAYERNKYYQTLLSIGDGVMVVDRNHNIEFLNAVAARLTGWSSEEARGKNYREVFVLSHEEEGHTINDPIAEAFSTGAVQELDSHAVLTSRQGKRYLLEDSAAAIPDEAGAPAGVVLVFRDVTEKKEQSKKIEYMSFHDALTDLYNRRFFEAEARRLDIEANLPITVLMGDVDSLKLTNDIFGHAYGDMLLKKIAAAMRSVCRQEDIIARWGGDEFVLLLPKTDGEKAAQLAERICEKLTCQQVQAIRCSISLGWATKEDAAQEIMQVLGSAEANMYAKKALDRTGTLNRDLNMLMDALFGKSERERQHAQRMQLVCRQLGESLGLPASDLDKLGDAGYLHDIGKVVVGTELLEADRDLDQLEGYDMRMHPAIGYRILSSFDTTLELAEAVLAHHENWDGSGYPKGLRGERIPLLARILAVVEAYDYLLHNFDAPKESERRAAALAELRLYTGKKFDPRITEAFLHMLGEEGQKGDPAGPESA